MGSLSVNNSLTKSQSWAFLRDLQFRNIKKSLLASDSLFFVQYIVHLLVCTYEKKIQWQSHTGIRFIWDCWDYGFEQFSQPRWMTLIHISWIAAPLIKKYKKLWITAPKIGNFFSVMRFEFSLKWIWPRLRSGFQRLHLRTSSSPKNNIIYY